MKVKWIFVFIAFIAIIGIGIVSATKNITMIVSWGMLGIINILLAIFIQGEKKDG